MTPEAPVRGTLTWVQIARLGVVQACLGAIVVLMTSTLNRILAVELALPVVIPGFLVALHYGVQITRPNWGFLSDQGGNRTRWIVLGMAMLALGALTAAAAVPVLERALGPGLILSVLAYALIGLGVGASGTSLLALLATATHPRRRAAAATITWLTMIAGIALTAIVAGAALEPYSHARLIEVVGAVALGALVLTALAVWGIEARVRAATAAAPRAQAMPFRQGLAEVWAEPRARAFTLFVFLSMTAYFMQELVLEPYGGLVFALSPGETTQMSGAQNGGVFLGMLTVGALCTGLGWGSLRAWVAAGCLGSAAMLGLIAAAPALALPLPPLAAGLGFWNGMFAVAAIGSMMQLAGEGRGQREGTRIGPWGASQAIAAGAGGLAGAALADGFRLVWDAPRAFGAVFLIEALLFVAAAAMALRILSRARPPAPTPDLVPGE